MVTALVNVLNRLRVVRRTRASRWARIAVKRSWARRRRRRTRRRDGAGARKQPQDRPRTEPPPAGRAKERGIRARACTFRHPSGNSGAGRTAMKTGSERCPGAEDPPAKPPADGAERLDPAVGALVGMVRLLSSPAPLCGTEARRQAEQLAALEQQLQELSPAAWHALTDDASAEAAAGAAPEVPADARQSSGGREA